MAYIIAREEPVTLATIGFRYEHNERTNKTYLNKDIDLSKTNYHFKKPDKSYKAKFDELVEAGVFSTKNVPLNKKDTSIGSEIIVAVGRDYLKTEEEAIRFFKVANDFLNEYFTVSLPDGRTVKGEELCLSSVVHLDEGNFGLHYVTTCVIAKEKMKKRTKKQIESGESPTSEGWYFQLSHSHFWESHKDNSGKLYYSYSKLNDELAEWYHNAGYSDIERGKRNSNAKHLHPNIFKQIMTETRKKAAENIQLITAERKGQKYVLDAKSYEYFLELQKNLNLIETITEERQRLNDVENAKLRMERYKVKLREGELNMNDVEKEFLEKRCQQAEKIAAEYKEQIDKQKETIRNLEVIVNFWKNLYLSMEKCVREMIGRIGRIMDKGTSEKELIEEAEQLIGNCEQADKLLMEGHKKVFVMTNESINAIE